METDVKPETAREYLRVSHDVSGRLRSADEQHADNERDAASAGWILGTPYAEAAAISASRYGHKSRPGFTALLADLAAGRFGAGVLIMWEPSRGSRRLSEWARFIELLQDNHVRLHVTSHGRTYDMAVARDRRSMHEDGTDSEFESAKISARVKRAMASNAAAGQPHGVTPYGYRRDYELNARGKRVYAGQHPDPVTAPVVRGIYAAIEERKTLRSIAAALNGRGLTTGTGNAWTPNRVREIAMTWAYAGKREHNGQVLDGDWAPLVDLEQFYVVRELLSDPKRRTSRPGRARHLLSLIAVCGVCGGGLAVRYRGGPQYWCHAKSCVRIDQAGLDDLVRELVLGRLARADAWPAISAGDNGNVTAARGELAELRARHAEMSAAMASGAISVTAFAAAEPPVLASIAAAERALAALSAPPALAMLLGDPGAGIRERWDAAAPAARREVVRILFENISVRRSETPGHHMPASERTTIEWRK